MRPECTCRVEWHGWTLEEHEAGCPWAEEEDCVSSMADALQAVTEARELADKALGILDERRDHRDAETLREIVGDLQALMNSWQRERDRWR